ncbi:MAG TPA: hypothetical protein VLA52_11955 [Thermohalobaculum sp.]|nr:hypothetical protein [Thermohalobaculum sp.]
MTAIEVANRCFQKALEIEVDGEGQARISGQLPAGDSRGVVYVAIRADGRALKVGMTRGRLLTHWNGIIDTINGKRTRKHEVQARGWWMDAVRGASFEVWCKIPSALIVGVENEAPVTLHSYHVEERYWAAVFKPLIGMKLSSRPKQRHA